MILEKNEKVAAADPPAYEDASPPPSQPAAAIAEQTDLATGLPPSTEDEPPQATQADADGPSPSLLSPLEHDVKRAFSAGPYAASSSSDGPQQLAATQRPVLLPPLYPPSTSSPFLLAYPPSLEPIVGRTPFLSFLRALNDALAPSALESADRAARAMPLLLGLTYGVTKAITGALTLGVAQATASLIEGPDSKTAAKIGKVWLPQGCVMLVGRDADHLLDQRLSGPRIHVRPDVAPITCTAPARVGQPPNWSLPAFVKPRAPARALHSPGAHPTVDGRPAAARRPRRRSAGAHEGGSKGQSENGRAAG